MNRPSLTALRALNDAAGASFSEAEHTGALAPQPLDEALARQERQQVEAALGQLPEDQRCAVQLAFYQGLSHSEIAEQLAIPLGTVKTRVRLGMLKLATLLQEAPASSS